MGKRRLPLRSSGEEKSDSNKRSRKDDEAGSSCGSEEDNGEIRLDGVVEHDCMQMTFEFNDMREIYSEGVTTLLRWFLPSHEAYELACVICNQGEVGTTVNGEGDDDTFAFSTLLPFSGSRDTGIVSKVINEVKTAVAGSSSGSATAMHELFTLSDTKNALMMLHARFSNLPLELIAPLFRNIEHDLEWVQSSENNSAVTVSTAELFHGTEHVLLLTPCSFSESSAVKIPAGGCVDICGSSDVLFDYFEDETFLDACSAAVLYRTAGLNKTIAAVLFPVSKLSKCTQALHEMLPQQTGATASSSRGYVRHHRKAVQEDPENNNEEYLVTSETHNAQNFEPAENSPDIAGSFKEITSSAEWESSVDKMYKTTYRIFIPINSSKINTGEEATKMVESREICIHHKTLTSIARVGLQVWRGAFLLADYIIHNRICIQSNIIVDLGCGTGIIGVILNACNHVGSVYLTDYSEEIVQLAELNVQQNYKEAEAYDPRDSVVAARVLDWTSNSNPRLQLPIDSAGIHASVAWTSDDIRRLGDSHLLCVAADVIYDDILTTSLFRKAAQIMKPGEHIWLSLEKRYNFSIEDKELVANGYELFLKHVTSIPKDAVHPECIQKPSFVYDSPFGETIVCFQGRKCPINFPQRFFDYDRTQDLELWDIELVTLPLM